MKVSHYQFDPRPVEPLQVTAVCYQPDRPPLDGITLILGHAAACHKETWAPFLEHLFANQSEFQSGPKVLEAWSIEAPNHGESAAINDHDIQRKFPDFAWNGWIYPRAILAFLASKPDGVDFSRRHLVAVGHSFGGNALVLLQSLTTRFKFRAFILLDASLGAESEDSRHMLRVLTQLAWTKKDIWPSRKAALQYLSKQPGTRNWHPDVLRLFVEKGLRDHPASKLPDPCCFKGGVTLACSRTNEASLYVNHHHNDFAFEYLQRLYRENRAVYLIHSQTDEFNIVKAKVEQMTPDPVSGNGPVSVQQIVGGGHMFVQTKPQQTADAVWKALCDIQAKDVGFGMNQQADFTARL